MQERCSSRQDDLFQMQADAKLLVKGRFLLDEAPYAYITNTGRLYDSIIATTK